MIMAACESSSNSSDKSNSKATKMISSKFPTITDKGVAPFLLDASFTDIPPHGDYYDNIILGRFYVVLMGEAGEVEITEDELEEYYNNFGIDSEVLDFYGTGIVMHGNDTMLIAKYDQQGTIFEVEVFSNKLSFENGIHVGMSSEIMASQYNASFLTTDFIEGLASMFYYVKEIPNNITLWAAKVYDIFDGGEEEFGFPYYPTSGEIIEYNNCFFYKVPMDKVKNSHLVSILILKKDHDSYNLY